jgi:hypothetical protein
MWWLVQYTTITDPMASEHFIPIQCDVPTEILGCFFMPIAHLQIFYKHFTLLVTCKIQQRNNREAVSSAVLYTPDDGQSGQNM